MTVSKDLAQFVINLSYDRLSSELIAESKTRIIDTLGAVIAGSRTTIGQMLTGLAQTTIEDNRATILPSGKKADGLSAALVNSSLAHCAEIDDIHPGSVTCTGAMVVPAVLVFGEMGGATGRQLIEAMVAGYEVVTRVGLGVKGEKLLAKGWWPSSIAGPLGVAAAVSKLLGHDLETMTHAMGIAGILAGGLLTGGIEGPTGRHFLFGRSVQNGAQASLLAGKGFTGPSQILEDQRGLYLSRDVELSLDKMKTGLGQRYFFLGTHLKLFACALQLQAAVLALLELMKDKRLAHRDLQTVTAWLPPKALMTTNRPGIPPNHTAGVSYGPFILASAAVYGEVLPEQFGQEKMLAQEVQDVVGKVVLKEDEQLESHSDRWPAIVEVKCFDGTVHRKEVKDWSGKTAEARREMAEEKFRKLARGFFMTREIGEIFRVIDRLDEAENVGSLLQTYCCASARGDAEAAEPGT
jgi:2-methylcitrate dehydratase PrpD